MVRIFRSSSCQALDGRFYSALSAVAGSVAAARVAGVHAAIASTTSEQQRRAAECDRIDRRHADQHALRERADRRRPAPARSTPPIAPSVPACFSTIDRMSRFDAPSAMRIAISRVRCATRNAIRP